MQHTLQTSLFFALLIASLAISCDQGSPPGDRSVAKAVLSDPLAIDSTIDQFIDDGAFPFIYVRLEHLDGSVMYEHTAVNRSLVPELEINEDTWIRIWSMSKIITISAVLDLVEDGILALDDPVTKYIPEFQDLKVAVTADGRNLGDLGRNEWALACPYQLVPMDSVMTVRHLINHQAGFYYAVTELPCLDSLASASNLPTSGSSQEFIDAVAKLPLIIQPGTNDYYGTNTTILGFVAERATGKSLKQLIEERVTDPMQITGLQYSLDDPGLLTPVFSGKDTVLREAHPGELDIFGPSFPIYDPANALYLGGEGMVATADGYADFVRMLVNHGELNGYRFLERTTVEDIYAPHTHLDNPYGHNGYNLWVAGDSTRIQGTGDKGIWMGGGYEGTHFWADPKRNFVGVIMSQIGWVPPGGWGRDDRIRAAIYQQLWAQEGE